LLLEILSDYIGEIRPVNGMEIPLARAPRLHQHQVRRNLTSCGASSTRGKMCCQDYAGTGSPAYFDYFEYLEREFSAALLP